MRLTTWHRPPVQIAPWEGSVLVQADASFVPTLVRELEPRKGRWLFPDAASFAIGYDAICKTQEALLMDVAERIIMEVRATRGIDDTHPEIFDPAADPFTLSLGTIQDNRRELEIANAHLAAIRTAVENQASPEELATIVERLGTIAALLA